MSIKTDHLSACLSRCSSRHKPIPISTKAQQGMALLTVLLLVVAIVVIAGSMLASQKMSIRQTSLVLNNDQSSQNLQSGFIIAKAIIEKEQQTNSYDSMDDAWAKPIPSIDIGGQQIQILMTDASGRFNLNNLYQNQQVNTLAYASLQSLLATLGLETNIARQVLDFQDVDNKVYGDGGDESVVYAEGGSFANQPFISVEQLLALPDMDMVTYQKLRPFVSVSPTFLPINVNTAEPLLISAVLNAKVQDLNLTSDRQKQIGNINPSADILPERLPDFRSNPQRNIEELWQQPNFQAYLNRQQQNNSSLENNINDGHAPQNSSDSTIQINNSLQAKRLFSVGSQAFNVQVTVTDNAGSGNKQHQRYATALIVKSDEEKNSQSQQQGVMVGDDSVNSSMVGQGWYIFYPRYWAYQPQ